MSPKHALGGSAFGLLIAAAPFMVAAQSAGGEDPITLFAKMAPVFSHDRCTGCHGRVNPERATGNNHSFGQFTDTRDCVDCHTEQSGWKTRPDFTFFNKTTKQLCQRQSEEVRLMRQAAANAHRSGAEAHAAYLSHLEQDKLIGAAFKGTRAGATPPADRPAMSRIDFVKAAKAWVEAGAGCGGWVGTITQDETFEANYGYPISVGAGPSTTSVKESATRTITITLKDGEATAKSSMSGRQTIQTVMRDVGPNGPCMTTVTQNSTWSGATSGGAYVRVNIAPDGKYTIRFKGPGEKTRSGGNTVSTGNCGPNVSFPPSNPIELDWSAKVFTINGQLPDPRERRYLNNDITSDGTNAAYPKSWLERSPVGTSRVDSGARIPVAVTIAWNLTLEE